MKTAEHNVTAVIELGTTSVRMVIGQLAGSAGVTVIDELEHAVSLGSDTLAAGRISFETTERCVAALRSFRNVLDEYNVKDRDVRVIATSAVREAANSDRFCDRILIATGFRVEVIDKSEVSRLTYQAIQPQVRKHPSFRNANVVVIEVGGGSTEAMIFAKGKVVSSHLYRLGSLRLRSQIDQDDMPSSQHEGLVRAEMTQMLAGLQSSLKSIKNPKILLLGAEARFVCSQAAAVRNATSGLWKISLDDFSRLTDSIVAMTVDEAVRKYDLTYTEAETLAPSLLIARTIAEEFELNSFYVSDVSLRTGVLVEHVKGEQWSTEYRRQIINSADVTARQYHVDIQHARNVASYGLAIINALRPRYSFSDREEVMFHAAALLHETGQRINIASHHKHAFYVILNSDIFGIGGSDLLQTALVARYHRRSSPKPTHPEYNALNQDARVSVSKLAAILRVANALDRLHGARLPRFTVSFTGNRLLIELPKGTPLQLIQQHVLERADLFREIFGADVVVEARKS